MDVCVVRQSVLQFLVMDILLSIVVFPDLFCVFYFGVADGSTFLIKNLIFSCTSPSVAEAPLLRDCNSHFYFGVASRCLSLALLARTNMRSPHAKNLLLHQVQYLHHYQCLLASHGYLSLHRMYDCILSLWLASNPSKSSWGDVLHGMNRTQDLRTVQHWTQSFVQFLQCTGCFLMIWFPISSWADDYLKIFYVV